jgi:antitoxin component of RelBE/YafQ-DinJ toxin-antitoxin module
MEQVCSESGLSVSVAFTGVVKKVGREKGILFEI